MTEEPRVSQDGLDVRDLVRRFGDVTALDGLSMTVRPGTIHGFVGANGAGKTTTMRIIVGVDHAERGTVLLDGRPIDADRRRRVGYLPEERGLYPDMRSRDQLVHFGRLHGLPAAVAAERADDYLERFGLADRAMDATSKLSLGNQQRVQLAAALLHEPDLLLLDEPFSGLDPVASDLMADLLVEQAARGVPVLFSSHQLDLVERLCDHVTVIRAGRAVADGTIEALRDERRTRRLRVVVEGTTPDWSTHPGVVASRPDGDGVVLDLTEGADTQHLLDVARAAGRVVAFAPVEPTLTELYREVAGAAGSRS